MIDNKTTNLKLPLPNLANYTKDDVPRLITALQMIDNLLATKALVNTKADAQQTASNINLKANTEDMINALARKALTGGSKSNAFLVGAATDPNHAARLLQLQQRVGSAGAPTGRNKIVDGRFDFWYEGTSQTTSGYGSDTMWSNWHAGSTKTHSMKTLTPGVDLPAIDVPSAKYFSRTIVNSVASSANRVYKATAIEGVRTLAGKKATLSFYAKADAAKNIAIEFTQNFGSSGSSSDTVTCIGSQLVALSTDWKRYVITVDIPSISGKTISTDNKDQLILYFWFDAGSSWVTRTANLGQQSGTFDLACVQLEEGSVATPFEELDNAIAFERLARFFEPVSYNGPGFANINNELNVSLRYRPKRATPVISLSSLSTVYARSATGAIASTTPTQITAIINGLTDRGCAAFILTGDTVTSNTVYQIYGASSVFVDARL